MEVFACPKSVSDAVDGDGRATSASAHATLSPGTFERVSIGGAGGGGGGGGGFGAVKDHRGGRPVAPRLRSQSSAVGLSPKSPLAARGGAAAEGAARRTRLAWPRRLRRRVWAASGRW